MRNRRSALTTSPFFGGGEELHSQRRTVPWVLHLPTQCRWAWCGFGCTLASGPRMGPRLYSSKLLKDQEGQKGCPTPGSIAFFVPKVESRVNQRSNYRQGLGSTDAWVNSGCSFHQIPKRNNNTGIVLHFSLRGFGEGARLWEAGGKLTVRPCSGGTSPDPAAAGSRFWHGRCQLHGDEPSLSSHLLINPLEPSEETNTKGKIRPR